jgi:hypothetical protein
MELQLNAIGVVLVLLALVHGIFPKYFDWPQGLSSLSLINRQLMYIHTLFIALFLVCIGVLCLTSAAEIIGTPLGRRISLVLAFVWVIRLVVQFFGYSAELWRGKTFETVVHILFVFLWTYLSAAFFWIYWYGSAL